MGSAFQVLRQNIHAPERCFRRNRRVTEPHVCREGAEAGAGREEEPLAPRSPRGGRQSPRTSSASADVEEEERPALGRRDAEPARGFGAGRRVFGARLRDPGVARAREDPERGVLRRRRRAVDRVRRRTSRPRSARPRVRRASRAARPQGRTPSRGSARRSSARARAGTRRRAGPRTRSPRRPRPRRSTGRAAAPSRRAPRGDARGIRRPEGLFGVFR